MPSAKRSLSIPELENYAQTHDVPLYSGNGNKGQADAALENLQQKYRSLDPDELEQYAQAQAIPVYKPSTLEKTIDTAHKGFHAIGEGIRYVDEKTGIPSAVGHAISYVDRFTGAPLRAGVSAAQESKSPDEISSAIHEQVGSEKPVPSSKDIAVKAGLPNKGYELPFQSSVPESKRVKVNPAGVAGFIGEMVTDPFSYALPAKALWAGAKLAPGVVSYLAKKTGKGLDNFVAGGVKVAGNVEPSQTKKYLEKPTRVNAAPLNEELEVALRQKMDAARATTQNLTIYKTVETLQNALMVEKKFSGAMSKGIDNLLKHHDQPFIKTQEIFGLFDIEIATLAKPGISKVARGAIADLNDLKDTAKLKLGNKEYITPVETRALMRDLRNDIDKWDKIAFNSKTDAALKNITEDQLSARLKKAFPDYADLMNMEERRVNIHKNLIQNFGTKKKAYSSLNKISKENPISDDILKDVEEYANLAIETPKKINEHFAKLNKGSARLGEFPIDTGLELKQKILSEIQGVRSSKQKFKNVERLSENRSQAIVKNQGSAKNANTLDSEALDNLENLYPNTPHQNLKQGMQDRGALNALTTSAANGSRTVNFATNFLKGSIAALGIGAATGAKHMEYIAPLAGFIWDRYGNQMLKAGLDLGYIPARKSAVFISDKMGQSIKHFKELQKSNPVVKKFSSMLDHAASQYGIRGVVAMHHMLMNSNPEYQKQFAQGMNL